MYPAKRKADHLNSKRTSLLDDGKEAPSAPRTTWFTFYSHRAQREYYYNPVSGVSSWQLPADGVISRLPGSPVQSTPSPQESKIPDLDLVFPLVPRTRRALDEQKKGNDAKMSAHRLLQIITKPRVALAMLLANLVLLTICCSNFGLTAVMLQDYNTTNHNNATIANINHRAPNQASKVSDTMTGNDAWVETSKESKPADDRDADGRPFPFLDLDDSDDKLYSVNSADELTPVDPPGREVEDSEQPEMQVDDMFDGGDSNIQHIQATEPVNEESLPENNTGEGAPPAKDTDSFDRLEEQDGPLIAPETTEQSSSNFLSIGSELSKSAVATNVPGSKDSEDETDAVFHDKVAAPKLLEQYDEGSVASNEEERSTIFSDEQPGKGNNYDEELGRPSNAECIRNDETSSGYQVKDDADAEELSKNENNATDNGSTMVDGIASGNFEFVSNLLLEEGQTEEAAPSADVPGSSHESQSNGEFKKASFDSESDKDEVQEADPDLQDSALRGSEMVPEIALLVEATEILIGKTSGLLERIIHDANSAGYSIDLKPKAVG